ncbi:MAG: hypothetical protein PHW73_01805 [Atribacterota bacterium]|nr:hypothetical protein [Atribacterota bacterium]
MNTGNWIFIVVIAFIVGFIAGIFYGRWYILIQIDYQEKLEKLRKLIIKQ